MLKNIKSALLGLFLAVSAAPAQSLTWSDTANGFNGLDNGGQVVSRNVYGSVRLRTNNPSFVPLELYAGNSPTLVLIGEKTTGPVAQIAGSGTCAFEVYQFNWSTYNYDLKYKINYDGSFSFKRVGMGDFTVFMPDVSTDSSVPSRQLATTAQVGRAANYMVSYEPPTTSTITIAANPMIADIVTTIDNPTMATSLSFSGLFEGARGTIIFKQGATPVSLTVPSNPGPYLTNWTTKIASGSGTGTTLFVNNSANGYTIIKWIYGNNGEMFVKVDSTYN